MVETSLPVCACEIQVSCVERRKPSPQIRDVFSVDSTSLFRRIPSEERGWIIYIL